MHDDEFDTNAELVRRLLHAQHPNWADLPITRVRSAGTDNAMYRLGNDLAVRMPRIHWAVENIAKEHAWLSRLATHLPLPVPLPVAIGEPEESFPHPWTVVRWLPGQLATLERLDDPVRAARELATFVLALRAVDGSSGPAHLRGKALRLQDESVRRGVAGLRGEIDAARFMEAWHRALATPEHDGPPRWFHGDLAYLNLLAHSGEIAGVIDWGTCGVGDPAIDTTVAWSLFPADAREAYREALGVDDAEWERGRGWVLTGVVAIPYYRDTNPLLVTDKITAIEAVLASPT